MDLGSRVTTDLTPEERRIFKGFQRRYERIVQKCRQMQIDAQAWNDMHPDEEPIELSFDFVEDLKEG
ncbi:MAG: hypothetical protein KAV00_01850 [Phycisphaerae bacterium]|nr:hypothetical protein [Phycisphaerae bacterium]